MRDEIQSAVRPYRTSSIYLQVIKFAEEVSQITGRQCALDLGLTRNLVSEIHKARKLAPELRRAGLDTTKI
jgi:hypothetical protein